MPAPMELVRRRVPQFVIGSILVGWAFVEVVSTFIQNAGLPGDFFFVALAAAGSGVVAASVLSWFHGAEGRQRVQPLEVALLVVIGLAFVALSARILLE
jgi:hypothetical protein